VAVPVPIPEYVSYEGIFGMEREVYATGMAMKSMRDASRTYGYHGSALTPPASGWRRKKPVTGEPHRDKSVRIEITLKNGREKIEAEANGRIWKTGATGERRLMKRLDEKKLKELIRLAGKLNWNELDGKSFGDGSGEQKELTIILGDRKLTLTFKTGSDKGLPEEVSAIIRLIT